MGDGLRRRDFMSAGALAAGALAFGPTFWRRALAAGAATAGDGPYGPLLPGDENGIMLPRGFRSRIVARGLEPVPGTAYPWHPYSDGGAVFATDDGGWIYVSNSESLAPTGAGSSALRFDAGGEVVDAYRILGGTNANCAGGRTPWGTWLSCEEYPFGQVWEADPTGRELPIVRQALGAFNHEAAAVDPVGKQIYLTEDESDGGFYRFTPEDYPNLDKGRLEVAVVAPGNSVRWERVPDPSAIPVATRQQVATMTKFDGGEGIWFDSGTIYFSTKGDNRVWAYDTQASQIEAIYHHASTPGAALKGVDNLTVTPSGDIYVCEDGGNFEIAMITPERVVAPMLRCVGPEHVDQLSAGDGSGPSELAGVAFDPSGTRMYFSSQRASQSGIVYEISGPFRLPAGAAPNATAAPVVEPGPPGSGAGIAGGDQDAERDAPGIKLTCRRRLSLPRVLARGGVRVAVRVDEPGELRLALRTPDLKRRRGERGSSDRPEIVTLGSVRRTFSKPGRYKVTVKLRRDAVRRLRRHRSVGVRVTAQVVDVDRNASVANRRLRIDRR